MRALNALVWSVPLALALVGCGNDDDDTGRVDTDTDDTDTTPAPAAVAAPSCAPNAVVPTVLTCTWTSEVAGAGQLELSLDGAVAKTTGAGASGTSHTATVVGLKAARSYEVVAIVDGERSAATSFTVEDPIWRPDVEVTGAPTHPYVLTALTNEFSSWPVVFDADGDLVWWTETQPNTLVTSVRLSNDGRSVLFATYALDWSADVGTIHRVALDGSEVVETRALLAHHDFLENDDGTFSWLGYEYRDYDGTMWASDAIRRGPEGSSDTSEAVIEWSWFDHYGMDPWLADPAALSVALGNADYEWTHTNSLMRVDGFDGYFIMSKFLDTILKVDRAGTKLWEMGGAYSDFVNPDGTAPWGGLEDNDLWSHAHMSHFWEGGFVVFDNGAHNGPGGTALSRVVEYAYDEAASPMVVEEVWSFEEASGRFTNLMGDARKLDNGHVLVSWATLGYFQELDPATDAPVWTADIAQGEGIVTRMIPLDTL